MAVSRVKNLAWVNVSCANFCELKWVHCKRLFVLLINSTTQKDLSLRALLERFSLIQDGVLPLLVLRVNCCEFTI